MKVLKPASDVSIHVEIRCGVIFLTQLGSVDNLFNNAVGIEMEG